MGWRGGDTKGRRRIVFIRLSQKRRGRGGEKMKRHSEWVGVLDGVVGVVGGRARTELYGCFRWYTVVVVVLLGKLASQSG